MSRFIVPPYLLAHLAEADSPRLHRAPQAARNGLLAIEAVDRNATPPVVQSALGGEAVLERTIFDARGTEDLPGVRVRG